MSNNKPTGLAIIASIKELNLHILNDGEEVLTVNVENYRIAGSIAELMSAIQNLVLQNENLENLAASNAATNH